MKTKSDISYFEEAQSWHQELRENRERIIAIYQKVTVALLVSICALSIVVAVIASKKDVVPFLAIADKRTGEVTTPHKIDKTQDINFQMLKHLTLTYVQARESYNFINLNSPFHQVLAMSSPKIQRGYRAFMQPGENKESPITILGKTKYVKVDIQSVNQLPGEHLLDVRFTQRLIDANTDSEIESHDYRVTMGWDVKKQKQGLKELELNPLGFMVTHYDKQPITV